MASKHSRHVGSNKTALKSEQSINKRVFLLNHIYYALCLCRVAEIGKLIITAHTLYNIVHYNHYNENTDNIGKHCLFGFIMHSLITLCSISISRMIFDIELDRVNIFYFILFPQTFLLCTIIKYESEERIAIIYDALYRFGINNTNKIKQLAISADYYILLAKQRYYCRLLPTHRKLLNNIQRNTSEQGVNVENIDLSLCAPYDNSPCLWQLYVNRVMCVVSVVDSIAILYYYRKHSDYAMSLLFVICECIVRLSVYWSYTKLYYWIDCIVRSDPNGFDREVFEDVDLMLANIKEIHQIMFHGNNYTQTIQDCVPTLSKDMAHIITLYLFGERLKAKQYVETWLGKCINAQNLLTWSARMYHKTTHKDLVFRSRP